jgi:MraZ protein
MFFGQYDHTLDDKGRLTVPSAFRELLEGGAYITRGLDENLIVMRTGEYDVLYHKINTLSITDQQARDLARDLFGNGALLELDKAGRFLIPQFLRSKAGIDSTVKVIGAGAYFEIWSLENWRQKEADSEKGGTRANKFKDLNVTLQSDEKS